MIDVNELFYLFNPDGFCMKGRRWIFDVPIVDKLYCRQILLLYFFKSDRNHILCMTGCLRFVENSFEIIQYLQIAFSSEVARFSILTSISSHLPYTHRLLFLLHRFWMFLFYSFPALKTPFEMLYFQSQSKSKSI